MKIVVINQKFYVAGVELNIKADTISIKSVLTTSDFIPFNSKVNKLLGLTSKMYPEDTHRSENYFMIRPVMISSIDIVHLKCDFVDSPIVIGVREQILFSSDLSAPAGQKNIIKTCNCFVQKEKQQKIRQIPFFLWRLNHNQVDFNNETIAGHKSNHQCLIQPVYNNNQKVQPDVINDLQ